MNNNDEQKLKIDEKLATLRFICDNVSHIEVCMDKCRKCKDKPCLYFCPAKVYNESEDDGTIAVEYENCLECGTCRICCPQDAIKWNYPKGAQGVSYRFG